MNRPDGDLFRHGHGLKCVLEKAELVTGADDIILAHSVANLKVDSFKIT